MRTQALAGGLIEMTVPDKPPSRLQRGDYLTRLTPAGLCWVFQRNHAQHFGH